MFDITPTKVFRDSVHGYISVPKCFVDHIIDTELFQRLRNIDQTGMRTLYPDAKHDRFGHSLGVFYLGSRAVDALLTNFSDNKYWRITSDHTRTLFWAKNKLLFLTACLLHDIGHVPFSHSLEEFVYVNSNEDGKTFELLFKEKLNKMESDGEEVLGKEDAIKSAPHELLGAMLVLERFKPSVSAIYADLRDEKYPQDKSESFLYAEHYERDNYIDDSELDRDICFIARMITGLKYKSIDPKSQIRNCFIELLSGNNFDVDKLDYVIRDTQMSGISNINIDIERLLKAVSIIAKTKFINQCFECKDCSGLTVHAMSNHTLIRRISDKTGTNWKRFFHIEGTFKGTFIFEAGTRFRIGKGSKIASLFGEKQGVRIVFWNDSYVAKFVNTGKVWQDGELLFEKASKPIPLSSKPNSPFEIKLLNAVLASNTDFCFQAKSKGYIEINGKCDLYISGKWNTASSVSFFENATISGPINNIEFMGDVLGEAIPDQSAHTLFSVGFQKQALNIIANVLEARNYLYLWIYAHHKVVYYANFLLPILAKELLAIAENETSIFPWHLNYKDLICLDDAYIWTVIKFFYHNSPKQMDSDVQALSREILTRRYKISVWKSLAEFQLLFESLPEEDTKKIRQYFRDGIDKNRICILDRDGDVTAGYLKEELVTQISEASELECIENIVCVIAKYKSKPMDPRENYVMIEKNPVPLDRFAIFSQKEDAEGSDYKDYFYLYYDFNSNKSSASEALTVETATARIRIALKRLARQGALKNPLD